MMNSQTARTTEHAPQFTVIEGGNDPAALAEARKRARPVLQAWLDEVEAKSRRQLLGLAIAKLFANAGPSANEGYAYLGQQRIGLALDRKPRTVRTALAFLCKAKLLACLRGGPGKPARWIFCRDGKPILDSDPARKLAARAAIHCRQERQSIAGLERQETADNPFLLEPIEKNSPLSFFPPAAASEAGGGIFHDRVEEQTVAVAPEPAAEPPALPSPSGAAPAPLAVTDPDTYCFHRLWFACETSKPGSIGYAHAEWRKLEQEDKAAIGRLIDQNRRIVLACYVGSWLRMRGWKISLGLPRTVEVQEGTLAWAHCQRLYRDKHGTGSPISKDGNWGFPEEWVRQFSLRQRQQQLGREEERAERAKTLLR
jgi:hypothetical protein